VPVVCWKVSGVPESSSDGLLLPGGISLISGKVSILISSSSSLSRLVVFLCGFFGGFRLCLGFQSVGCAACSPFMWRTFFLAFWSCIS